MSKNRNRAKFNKAQTSREYRILIYGELYPPYYEEGWNFYKKTNLCKFEVREYRTWKYNRKTQYKE